MAAPAYRASAGSSGTTGTGDRTIAFTPAVGDLAVLVVALANNTEQPVVTDNQGGTYTFIRQQLWDSSTHNLLVYVRDALAAAAVVHTVTVDTTSNEGGCIVALAFNNFGKVGAAAVRQSGGQSNQAAGGTPAPPLPANALTRNPTLIAIVSADGSNTLPAGWTQRQNPTIATPTATLVVATRNSGFTSTTPTWTTTPDQPFATVVVELDGDIPVTGTWSGTAAFSGTLTGEQGLSPIDGSWAGTSTFSGNLTGTAALSGTWSGTCTMSGALTGTAAITGSFAGTSTFEGEIGATIALQGSFEATSTFGGTLLGVAALAGTWSATSTFEGDIVDGGNPAPAIDGPVATANTTAPALTSSTTEAAKSARTTEAAHTRRTTAPACAREGDAIMGKPWYINADDEAGELRERIVRPAYVERDGTEVPLEAINIEDAAVSLEWWNGSAWVAITGTGTVADSLEVDSETRPIWEAVFVRGQNATSAIPAGEHPRRWVFSWLAGAQQLRVPERGHDRLVVNASPS